MKNWTVRSKPHHLPVTTLINTNKRSSSSFASCSSSQTQPPSLHTPRTAPADAGTTTMERLPSDLSVEIAKHVAESAENPMDELAHLRATNADMRKACSNPAVGRSIPLCWVLHRGAWEPYYSDTYRTELTRRLASIGNTNACFYEGMSAVFVAHRDNCNPPSNMLQRSATQGHALARYVLALVHHRSNFGPETDIIAKKLMRQVEDDEPATNQVWSNKQCTVHLQEAIQFVQQLPQIHASNRPLPPLVKPQARHEGNNCATLGCGKIEGWHQWASFCSEDCRIDNECVRFFRSFW